MVLEIKAVGGYGEIGRNCTLIRYDDEAVLLDLGLHMENYVALTEDEDVVKISQKLLLEHEAVPDIRKISDILPKIKALVISHAHLDHVGAVPFFGNKFSCPVYGTPYTIEVLRTLIREEELPFKNDLVAKPENALFKVSKHIKIEFINTTHSIPQTVMVVVHTPDGSVMYTNDFKLDYTPVIGKKPNVKRLKELNLKATIIDSLYADDPRKTPSELIAKEMLKDTLFGVDISGKAIIVSTFSSHLSRLKSIIEIGKKLGRKVVFCGRSLAKYVEAAETIKLVNFTKDVEMVKYGSQIRRTFKKIKNPHDYLFVVTGHQGEPRATLAKMVYQNMFPFEPDDIVVFSCHVIPTPTNLENREKLDAALKDKHVRLFKNVHVSGHAGREDIRELLHMIKTEHVIPSHGNVAKNKAAIELAKEVGFDKSKTHLIFNDQSILL